jgi:hypothetical protein
MTAWHRRRWRLPWWTLVVLLAACGELTGPLSLTLTESELQAALAKRFPVQRRILEVLELQLSAPSVRLLPQANRLATELAFLGNDKLTGRSLKGVVAMNFGLRLEAADGTVRLTQPRFERVEISNDSGAPGGPGRLAGQVQRLAGPWAEQLLDDMVVYRISTERLELLRAAGYQPGTLAVTPRGVEVTVLPLGAGAASSPPK